MEQAGNIEDTGNREHQKLGEAKPIWPRDRRKGNSVRSFAISIFDSFEYILCWFYYLVGLVANFSDTELQGALFDGADIGGARLSQSYDLSDTQIEGACASSDTPPILPVHLEWTEKRC